MDNPIDHPLDLGLVNYTRHPSNPDYIVYRFADENRAKSFEETLKEKNISFESDTVEKKLVTFYLYAIHKNDFKVTEKINFTVEAKHRKHLLPFAAFRYFMIIFTAIILFLAIMGYCKAQEKLRSYDENTPSVNSAE